MTSGGGSTEVIIFKEGGKQQERREMPCEIIYNLFGVLSRGSQA
jgi:hypothetical protein